ncbi:hypothetical protein BHM03_00018862 [Ensete ventricosum]|nr:hypothetical protein BHM03_00018862 [Ensete ventricosum]
MCGYSAGFGWSWGPLSWIIPSEIFPVEIRSAGQSISVAINLGLTFVQTQTFLAMLCRFKQGTFAFYAAWVVVMTAFVAFLLPETKGVPLEFMSELWRRHWYWGRFLVDKREHGLPHRLSPAVLRRPLDAKGSVMLLGGVTFLVGMAIDAAVVNIEMLILGRLLLGVGVGFINQAVPVYLAETASTKWRGVITTGVQLFIAIGVVAANVTNYGTSHISTAWIIPTEIFRWISSRRDRASAWPSTWASQAFLAMLCSFKYGTFIFYAAWIVVMTAFVAVFLPETKRVPLEPWMPAIGIPRR